ncbi:hypothetical protein An17g01510 [Aspergillus niger]|uniref:Uncharacterized protein n=2 Tax=Aspergillus niger TaxID=5061 RepID=A2R9I1_ASPNC|nr:hypothetical protein An17g01510 [Aspergillus niger]CAK43047.1 hypothetical protein An17g01510 [Aspergillus niger]
MYAGHCRPMQALQIMSKSPGGAAAHATITPHDQRDDGRTGGQELAGISIITRVSVSHSQSLSPFPIEGDDVWRREKCYNPLEGIMSRLEEGIVLLRTSALVIWATASGQ